MFNGINKDAFLDLYINNIYIQVFGQKNNVPINFRKRKVRNKPFTSIKCTHTCFSEVVFIKRIIWVSWVGLLCDGVFNTCNLEKVRVKQAESCYYEFISHLYCVCRSHLTWTMHSEGLLLGSTFVLQFLISTIQN